MKDFIIAKQGDGVPIISLILVFSLTAVRAFLFDKVKSNDANWIKMILSFLIPGKAVKFVPVNISKIDLIQAGTI